MRHVCKNKPQMGQKRKITKFLWFPKKIKNEWRWLEKTTFVQMYIEEHSNTWMVSTKGWIDLYWDSIPE